MIKFHDSTLVFTLNSYEILSTFSIYFNLFSIYFQHTFCKRCVTERHDGKNFLLFDISLISIFKNSVK